ncbi:PiggyBac transposable element-derived protein 4, partial [Stegodyphus mimosarum]
MVLFYTRNIEDNTPPIWILDLVDCLIERCGIVNENKGRPGILLNLLWLTERHFTEMISPTKKKVRPRMQCFICSSKKSNSGKRVRKETRYFCIDCDNGLHILKYIIS